MVGKELALEKKVPFSVTKGGNNPVFTGNARSLAILDKFERQEKLGKEKKQDVKTNEKVEKMKQAFSEYLRAKRFAEPEVEYRDALGMAKSLKHAAADVTIFSLGLAQFQQEDGFSNRAGFFLSALMNSCEGREFIVFTQDLSVPVNYLGYRNSKGITVQGSVGDYAGLRMRGGLWSAIRASLICDSDEPNPLRNGDYLWLGKKGRMAVNGDAGNHLGNAMMGGKITVNGDAGSYACREMRGGKVTVKGDAGFGIGRNMRGGRAYVKGNAGHDAGFGMEGGLLRVRGKIASTDIGTRMTEMLGDMLFDPKYLLFKLMQPLPFWQGMVIEGKWPLHALISVFCDAGRKLREMFKRSDDGYE